MKILSMAEYRAYVSGALKDKGKYFIAGFRAAEKAAAKGGER